MRTTDRKKVYNRQFVARTVTTDRAMRTTDREYVHTTVTLNKKHNEKDNEMVQLTKNNFETNGAPYKQILISRSM